MIGPQRVALYWFGIVLLLALITGCDDSPAGDRRDRATAPDGTYIIVTTTAMIGDIVRNVAGDRATVHVLMGPGTDPHLYRPTRSDITKLLNADIVFYNGLNLEGRMTETLAKVAGSGVDVHSVTDMILDRYLLEADDEENGGIDPHVWMDPRGWVQAANAVTHALSLFDFEYAEVYAANSREYLEALLELDNYVREIMATIPHDHRVLVTAHDAFGYFARAYGLEVQAIQGISTESEAGLRRIEELVNLIVTREIPTVFTETTVPDRNVRALIEGAQARDHTVTIGGELFSDAMGEDGTWEGTYIGMIDHNATTIARALGGSPPDGGFRAWREARTQAPAPDQRD
jgi:manganese/zinc/iron transport system substrate-binding protein